MKIVKSINCFCVSVTILTRVSIFNYTVFVDNRLHFLINEIRGDQPTVSTFLHISSAGSQIGCL